MKKLFLSLVFLLATGSTFMNAGTNLTSLNEAEVKDAVADCITQSNTTYTAVNNYTNNHDLAFAISEAQLSDCLDEADFIEENS